jgi:hypothetical protein
MTPLVTPDQGLNLPLQTEIRIVTVIGTVTVPLLRFPTRGETATNVVVVNVEASANVMIALGGETANEAGSLLVVAASGNGLLVIPTTAKIVVRDTQKNVSIPTLSLFFYLFSDPPLPPPKAFVPNFSVLLHQFPSFPPGLPRPSRRIPWRRLRASAIPHTHPAPFPYKNSYVSPPRIHPPLPRFL